MQKNIRPETKRLSHVLSKQKEESLPAPLKWYYRKEEEKVVGKMLKDIEAQDISSIPVDSDGKIVGDVYLRVHEDIAREILSFSQTPDTALAAAGLEQKEYLVTAMGSIVGSRLPYLFVRGVRLAEVKQYLSLADQKPTLSGLFTFIRETGADLVYYHPDEAQPLYGLPATR